MSETQSLDDVTVVFDLDGTLVDTAPDLIAALNHSLAADGLAPVPASDVRGMIGQGAKAMIRKGLGFHHEAFDEERIDRLWQIFLEFYAENIAVNSDLFPGCRAALDRLADAGARLAVCTNKTQGLTDRLLDQLSLSDRFTAIVGADSVPARKPDAGHILETLRLAKHSADRRAVMVGDSQTDERAALNAGLPFVFCPFGYGPIEAEPPAERTILSTYADLDRSFITAMFD